MLELAFEESITLALVSQLRINRTKPRCNFGYVLHNAKIARKSYLAARKEIPSSRLQHSCQFRRKDIYRKVSGPESAQSVQIADSIEVNRTKRNEVVFVARSTDLILRLIL